MNRNSMLKLAVVALAAGGAAAFTMGTHTGSTTVAAEGSTPQSLYVQNCSGCHGKDGHAQTPRGKKYKADDITGGVSTSKTTRIVTNGKGKMPSFKKRLTAKQISQIAGYVSGL